MACSGMIRSRIAALYGNGQFPVLDFLPCGDTADSYELWDSSWELNRIALKTHCHSRQIGLYCRGKEMFYENICGSCGNDKNVESRYSVDDGVYGEYLRESIESARSRAAGGRGACAGEGESGGFTGSGARGDFFYFRWE